MIIKDLFDWFGEQINNYNLFITDTDEGNDVSTIRRQRYATRLTLFCSLVIIFYILSFIAFVSPQTRFITISNITPSVFNQLRNEHGETLSCPCSTTTITYRNFVFNSISFHPVCSSIFISEEWIDTLYFSNASAFLVMDFRTTAYSQFKLLAALCKFCQETIFQIEIDLDNNTLITAKLLSENEVRSQVIGNIELIQSSKPIQVLLSLYFLQIISQSNSFISSLNINAAINIYIDKQDYIIGGGFTTYRNKKSSEFASTILTCESTNSVIPVGFYQISYEDSSDYHLWWPEYLPYFEPEPSAMVDGFFGGCTVFDSLLMSTLDCLYKIECLERLRYYFPKLKSMNSSWMNILLISKQQNRSLYNHLNNLLIEQWTTNINYTTYFQTCAPIICTYSKTDRMNLTYTITLLLSLYGGLIFILRLLTHLLIDILFKFKLHQINTQLNNEQNLSIIRRTIQWIIQLNLFQSIRQQTPTNIKEQRLSTRIYLILLSSSYLIIILLTTLNTQTITIIESNPSLIEYKSYEKLYSNSLQCPCSNITISYSIFNSFHPILHEICSSNFITDSWIMMMRLLQGDSLMTGFDFDFNWRGINAQQMQLLSMSCQRANKTIEDAIHRFNQRSFTTSKVLTQSNFNAVMNTTVDQFIRSLIIDFNLLFNTSHLFTQVDQPFTKPNQNNLILKSTTQMTIKMNRLIMNTEIFSECICSTNPDCRLPFSFIDLQVKKSNRTSNSTYNLRSGMEQGCFVIDSLLHSTLECFYSNDCLSILYHYMNRTFYTYNTGVTWFTVPPLIYESSTISRFPPTTSMNIIIKQMMVEQWNSFYSFDHYYTACSPNYCTYSQTTRAGAIGIILTLISTIGGLTVALRLITPQIIKLTSNLFQPKINKQINRIRPRLCVRIKILLTNIVERIYRELIDLNMFPQENFGRNINRIRMKQLGQLSTRLYIILLISGLSILLLYSIIQPRILIKTFNKPTLNSYNHLILDHNNSLQCPCSMISSMYKQYVTIEPRFHPICSSRFATNKWRLKITSNLAADVSIYHHRDYRRFLSAHLQFLIGICELSIQSVNDSIDQFLSSLFITPQLQSLKDFQKHIDSLVIQRQSIAPIAVANLINLLRNINHGNAILSTYETNFKYYIPKWYNSTFFFGYPALSSLVLTEPVIYDDECSCAFTSNCTTQAVFINQDLSKNISIKGLKMGCTPSESFLASTLECFYDSSCLQIIQEQVNYIKTNYSPIMYVANSSRFAPNMTLVNLVNELFIENWITTIDYSAYFYNCSPEFCSYTYRQQVNSLYTTTLLIALYGGLSVVLQWICPNIIYFFVNTFWYRKKRFNTVGSIRTIEIDIITTDHAKPVSTPSTAELIDGFEYLSNGSFILQCSLTNMEEKLWFLQPELSISGVRRLTNGTFTCRLNRSLTDDITYEIDLWIGKQGMSVGIGILEGVGDRVGFLVRS
ncbi:hypothetical protein I4U23_000188 [Adineta vaga]|nr:hypothetical protein I4U23_000188 [Adineta vaga]